MFRIFFQLRFIAGIVMFAASFWGYHLVRVETSEHERVHNNLANELAERVVNDLPLTDDTVAVSVARLANDEENVLNGMLRHWLHRHGHRVTAPTRIEQLQQYFLNRTVVQTPADAEQLARNEGAEFVAFGEMVQLCTIPGQSRLEARLQLYDVSQRKIIADVTCSVPSDLPTSTAAPNRSGIDGPFRNKCIVAAVWLLVIAALPIATAQPIARVLRRGSNRCNAVMLLAYILLAAGSAELLWAGRIDHWIAWPLLLILTLFAATYFAIMCQSLDNYRT